MFWVTNHMNQFKIPFGKATPTKFKIQNTLPKAKATEIQIYRELILRKCDNQTNCRVRQSH